MPIRKGPLTLNDTGTEVIACDEDAKSAVIPDGVTSIGDYAFHWCEYLQHVDIPNSVTSIGEGAFSYSALLQINIPDGVTSIGEAAFDFTLLKQINIPNGVTDIGEIPFEGCCCLKKIDVSIDNNNYRSIEGILFSKDLTLLIKFPSGKDEKKYKIPRSVTSIEDYAFCDCEDLQQIDIPDSVINIGRGALERCSALKELHFKSMNIDKIEISPSAFEDTFDYNQCTLYIPAGSREAYSHHPIFCKFKNIEEEKQIGRK